MPCDSRPKVILDYGRPVLVREQLTDNGCQIEEVYKTKLTVICQMRLADAVCAAAYEADQFAETIEHGGILRITKGGRMATVKVHRVVVEGQRGGAWKWTPTDAQGRVKLAGGKSGYSRRWDAVRGAKRAHGAKIRIDYA